MTPAREPAPNGDEATDEVIDFLVACAVMLRATVVVESGTHKGRTLKALADALPSAHIHSADIVNHGVPMHPRPNATFHLCSFDAMLARLDGPIDLAFIDASDTVNIICPRLVHLDAVMARLKPGGIAVIDDTATCDWTGALEIRRRGGLQFFDFHGITVIQKAWA